VNDANSANTVQLSVARNNGIINYNSRITSSGITVLSVGNSVLVLDNVAALSNVASDTSWTATYTSAEFTVTADDAFLFIGIGAEGFDSDSSGYFGVDNVSIVSGGPAAVRGSLIIIR
jgi:hypothetical protein